jgi:preprotein translocase subunit SecF
MWWARPWAISLRSRPLLATLYSLLGMLVYLWFRFQLIYGVAAVVAVLPRHADHGGRLRAD